VTSVAGTGSHWTSVGSSAVYSATSKGFRLYLGNCGGSNCITYAKNYGWVVNWIADKSGKNSGCGSTTSWKKYSNTGLYTDTSTASAGFSKTPAYVTSIHGTSSHWTLRGPHSIYTPTKTGFRTYVYGNNDPNFARQYHWKMCWIGTTDSSFSAQSTPKNWIAYGDHGRSDTSVAGITKRAGYKNIYVTSQIGDTSHWTTYGAGSIYPDGSGNLRTYIYGLSAAFMNQYNHRVNAVVGFQKLASYSCDETKNWINGMQYQQISLTDSCGSGNCAGNPKYGGPNSKTKAMAYCKDQCNVKNGCTGFFFQTHNNGHEICGFYTSALGSYQWHGHKNGAICKRNA
jgi:hypothetical protein